MIELDRDGSVFVLAMRGGENRFRPDVLDAINAALDEVEASAAPRALVTTGDGKFYSNGLDLDWLASAPDRATEYLAAVYRLLGRMLGFPALTVAAVNGHAFGAGALLATFTVTPAMSALLLPATVAEIDTAVVRVLRRGYRPVVAFVLAVLGDLFVNTPFGLSALVASVVAFLADDHPGALMDILGQFAIRGVNLTRIESRPTGDGIGRYCFFIDCEGHVGQARVGEALMGLRRICSAVRFLGSYPEAGLPAAGQVQAAQEDKSDADFIDAAEWLARIRSGEA